MNKDIKLNEEQLKKQQEMMDGFEKEIQKLEFQTKNTNLINKKNNVLRKLKLTTTVLRFTLPYVLATTTSIASYVLIKDYNAIKISESGVELIKNVEENPNKAFNSFLVMFPITEITAYVYRKSSNFNFEEEVEKDLKRFPEIYQLDKELELELKKDNYYCLKRK